MRRFLACIESRTSCLVAAVLFKTGYKFGLVRHVFRNAHNVFISSDRRKVDDTDNVFAVRRLSHKRNYILFEIVDDNPFETFGTAIELPKRRICKIESIEVFHPLLAHSVFRIIEK